MLADLSTKNDVRGLFELIEIPADNLSRGVYPIVEMALNIFIFMQNANGVKTDPCAAAHQQNMAKYQHLFAVLFTATFIFRFMVWNAKSNPHAKTTRVLNTTVPLVSNKKKTDAAIELQPLGARYNNYNPKKKTAMIHSAFPANSIWQHWVQSGQADHELWLPNVENIHENAPSDCFARSLFMFSSR